MKKNTFYKLIAFCFILIISFCCILPALTDGDIVFAGDKEEITAEPANLLERAIAYVFLLVATGLFFLIGIAAGQPLTVETIIFNKYPNTSLNIFANMPVMQPGMPAFNPYVGNPGIANTLGSAVNDFYSFFVKIAIVVYMIILLYVGVRVLFNTGTDQNAKYKEYLWYWIQGVFILFFFPYVMKYTIVLNDAFVKYIYDNKNMGIRNSITLPEVTASGGMGDMQTGIKAITDLLNAGSDYMSVMFKQGWEKGWLVYGLCFMVMVLQVLTLLIIYFKRLLITIFLIVVFPLVTISYAIDKLGDGKSQAFGNWYKEFVLNVFTNSFHAIVYVIGMALIIELGQTAGRNWLLMVILLSFISKGDEMLRGIFHMNGGGGDTVKGVGKTMLAAKGATDIITGTASRAKAMFGEDSRLAGVGRTAGILADAGVSAANARLEKYGAEVDNALEGDIETEDTTIEEHTEQNLGTALTSQEAAATALNAEATEDERNEALDQLLDIMNMEEGAEKDALLEEAFANLSDEEVETLQTLLEARAAANALMAGGLTEVQFNEKIEILLEQLKNPKNSHAKSIASQILGDPKNLDRLRLASQMKLKRPTAQMNDIINNASNRDATKRGSRYSGRFRQNVSMQRLAIARNANMPGNTSARGRIASALAEPGRVFKRAARQAEARVVLGFTANRAMNDVWKLRELERKARRLERQGKMDSKAYQQTKDKISKLTSSKSNIEFLRKRRAKYRSYGLSINGIGNSGKVVKSKYYKAGGIGQGTGVRPGAPGPMYRDSIVTLKRATGKSYTEGKAFSQKQVYKIRKTEMESKAGNSRDGTSLRKFGRTDAYQRYKNNRKAAKQARKEERQQYKQEKAKLKTQRSESISKLREERENLKGKYSCDYARSLNKKLKNAHNDITKARQMMKNSTDNAEAMGKAKALEQDALRRIQQATADQAAASRALRQNSAKLRALGVKIKRPTKAERTIENNLMSEYKSMRKLERVAETQQRKTSAYTSELDALNNTRIELVDLRAKARAKDAEKAKKKAEAEQNKANSFAEKLREQQAKQQLTDDILSSVQNERAAIQASLRDVGVKIPKVNDGSITARLTAAANGIEIGNSRASTKAQHDKRSVLEIGVDIHRAAEEVKAFDISEVPSALGSLTSEIGNAFAKAGSNAWHGVKGVFTKGESGMTLSEEVRALASREEAERRVIHGVFKEDAPPIVVEGTLPTTSSPTVVVVGDQAPISTTGSWTVPINTSTEYEKAKRDFEKIKNELFEQRKKDSPNTSEDDLKLSPVQEDALMKISCSVVALNQVDLGQYTAAEVISHIDNIKRMQSMFPPGSEGYEELTALLGKLKYSLDDIESNVRIQVLNDTSLIAQNDPNRQNIVDSSIEYIGNMSQDEVLLGALAFNPEDMPSSGYVSPAIARGSHETIQGLASSGLVTLSAAEEASIQESVAAQLKKYQREQTMREADQRIASTNEALLKAGGAFVKESAEAAVDIAVGMPLAVGSGLISMGMTGAGGKSDPILTGLAGYSMGDSVYNTGKGIVTGAGGHVASAISGAITKGKSSSSSIEPKPKKPEEPISFEQARAEAIAAKKAKYQGRTEMPKAGDEGSLASRYSKYKNSASNE